MKPTKTELAEALKLDQFPRSATYDPEWVIENQIGPNVLWLTEFLSQVMKLEPGMRVLDLGCGRATSSIFLAKEFGLQVWATDLWIKASDNWARVRAAGLEDQVFPIHAEARTLPFADDFFDAIISMDAYHYFGTDDLYLGYLVRFVRPGGEIGIVVPGLQHEFTNGPPEYLQPHWDWDFCCFHTPEWWRGHWEKTGKVEVELADRLPDGWKHWLKWLGVLEDEKWVRQQAEMVRVDAGRNLGFTRLVAHRKQDAS
jgi:cyclopropane fatty-acyl-phospholipid synthase-like methyltransferase